LAGLDPTTFNKSKRGADAGKLRWPSTESVAKVLTATGASLDDFVALVSDQAARAPLRSVPLIGWAQAGQSGFFDDAGFPKAMAGRKSRFPISPMLMPMRWRSRATPCCRFYRDGDRILVSPSANLRRGDRVVVKTLAGEVMAKQLGPAHRPAHRTQELQRGLRRPRLHDERYRLRASDHLGRQ